MRRNGIGFCVWCVLVAGCAEDTQPPGAGPGGGSSSAKRSAEGAATTSPSEFTEKSRADAQVTLRILDWEATEKLIAGHKGKVVVVDMWSTSCLPCIRELPSLVELHKKYRDQVACVTVSCDYLGIKGQPPESCREEVLEILREKGATFDNVLSSIDSDSLSKKLGFVSIPVVYVYGKDGMLRKRFDNEEELYGEEGFTYQNDIIPFVEKVLKGE